MTTNKMNLYIWWHLERVNSYLILEYLILVLFMLTLILFYIVFMNLIIVNKGQSNSII